MSSEMKRDLPPPASPRGGVRIYTLEVALLGGLMTERFVEANPVVTRTIAMQGDQTLAGLHRAIFDAFDRHDEQSYEFRFGSQPFEPGADRYTMDDGIPDDSAAPPAAGAAPRTTLDDLGLGVDRVFFYRFDFDDDWWHTIKVDAVELGAPSGEYPRVVARVGASPPQYFPLEDDEGRATPSPAPEADPDPGPRA
jgi:hypothetical protein